MAKKTISKKVKQEVDDYINLLKKDDLPISQVWLFGSFVNDKAHKWSDIDLCIVSPKFKNSWEGLQYLWQKRKKNYGLTIEPIGYTPQDFKDGSILINEIKKHGIQIKDF